MSVQAEITLNITQFSESVKRIMAEMRQVANAAKRTQQDINNIKAPKGPAGTMEGKGLGSNFIPDLPDAKASAFSYLRELWGVFKSAKPDNQTMKNLFGAIKDTGPDILKDSLKQYLKAKDLVGAAMRGDFVAGTLEAVSAVGVFGAEILMVAAGIAVFIGAAYAAVKAVQGLVSSTKELAQLNQQAFEAGVSVKQMVALERAFINAGSSADEAQTAMSRFAVKLAEAKSGAGNTYEALRVLSDISGKNLNPNVLSSKGSYQAAKEIIDALKLVKNEAQKTQLSSELFTMKSGPIVKAISDTGGLDTAETQTNRFGSIVQQAAGPASTMKVVFSDVWDSIGKAWDVIASRIIMGLEGIVRSFDALNLSGSIIEAADYIGQVFQILAPIITTPFLALGVILKGLLVIFNAIGAVISAVILKPMIFLLDVCNTIQKTIFKILSVFGLIKPSVDIKSAEEVKGQGFQNAFMPVQTGIASSLTKVGGGGESFGGGISILDIQREMLAVQKEQLAIMRKPVQTNMSDVTPDFGGGWM